MQLHQLHSGEDCTCVSEVSASQSVDVIKQTLLSRCQEHSSFTHKQITEHFPDERTEHFRLLALCSPQTLMLSSCTCHVNEWPLCQRPGKRRRLLTSVAPALKKGASDLILGHFSLACAHLSVCLCLILPGSC